MKIGDIISAIEAFAPLSLQESWDNTGLQVGIPDNECRGVLVCVDVTVDVVHEAINRGCNLIVSHHPLIFKGLKSLTGSTPVEVAVMTAICAEVAIYSSHTALDSARGGVSCTMAEMLGADVISALTTRDTLTFQGLGVVADLAEPMTPIQLLQHVQTTFGAKVARHTDYTHVMDDNTLITRIAMCGGSGGEFIGEAIEAGAQAYITGDVRYHDFVDHQDDILLIDIGHYETEECTKDIFYNIIKRQFADLPVYKSQDGTNPVQYSIL